MDKKSLVKFFVHLHALNHCLGRNAIELPNRRVRFEKGQAIRKIHLEGVLPCQITDGGEVNHLGRAERLLQAC